jgi:hypothetical protein
VLGEEPLEAVDVQVDPCFASDLAGEFDGQAIGVVQVEGDLGRDAVAALGPQPLDLASQLGGGAAQRGLEPLALADEGAGDPVGVLVELG